MRPVRAKALIINAFALAGRFAIFNPYTQGAALGYVLLGLSARFVDFWHTLYLSYICISNRSKLRVERTKKSLARNSRVLRVQWYVVYFQLFIVFGSWSVQFFKPQKPSFLFKMYYFCPSTVILLPSKSSPFAFQKYSLCIAKKP